ncbi:hypothetical protein [Moorena sp. SIO3B2]|uniref:hypothetical protein n=1 Tax=Moorena sp. SIO3B2 TaxID=2607827 RepID=UPI0013CDD042|nr:hypothetical protein [Moorena sp. SIO3B2]NEP35270.1 hypothetical protein [Moorena sp. SIO3B2]
MLIEQIASVQVLDQAFAWVCDSRAHYHFNGDIWHQWRWWHQKKNQIQGLIRSGRYRFRELRQIRAIDRIFEWWHSQDALVLKAISIVLTAHLLPHLSPRCFHLAGTGGIKGAVRDVLAHLWENKFVFRTDVQRLICQY